MRAYLDFNGHSVPVVVWEKILHIRKKYHLVIVDIEIVEALTKNDCNVITVYVEPAKCLRSRHFKNIERKAYRKFMARYDWDICFTEND